MTPENANHKLLTQAFQSIRSISDEGEYIAVSALWLNSPRVAKAPDFIRADIEAALERKRRELISVARPS